MVLPKLWVGALAAALVVLQVVQSLIQVSSPAHAVIGLSLVVLAGIGIAPSAAVYLKSVIPLPIAAVLSVLAGSLVAVQQTSFSMPPLWHAVLAGALTLLAAVGITPQQISAGNAAAPAPRHIGAAPARRRRK